MDKRIDLSEFKSHVDEYLKIGVDNFRVVRLCQNDLECELTAGENLFLYLANNSKFIIKLGPPLKYGEYVLAVHKLNKVKVYLSHKQPKNFNLMHSFSTHQINIFKREISRICVISCAFTILVS